MADIWFAQTLNQTHPSNLHFSSVKYNYAHITLELSGKKKKKIRPAHISGTDLQGQQMEVLQERKATQLKHEVQMGKNVGLFLFIERNVSMYIYHISSRRPQEDMKMTSPYQITSTF
jgi:hypothetical protein